MNTVGKLTYVINRSVKPKYIINLNSQPSTRLGEFIEVEVEINNARLLKQPASLDKQGFSLTSVHSTFTENLSEKDVTKSDYEKIKAAIMSITGASKVVIFDHTIRCSSPDGIDRGIAKHVHVDYSEDGFFEKLNKLGIDIAYQRVQQVNAWLPLNKVINVAPLAVCHSRTVSKEDLISCDLIYPDRIGQIYEVCHNPNHEWFYFPNMTSAELLLFTGYDNGFDTEHNVCPHTSFSLASETPNSPPRRSIEFRTCVIY